MGMPLPSQNFLPDVGALTGTTAIPQNADEARELTLQLAKARDDIDAELQSNIEVLSQQQATMTSPLVDSQGFPIATTDIVAVRSARARIIALRNDRKALDEKIRDLLEVALARRNNGAAGGDAAQQVSSTQSNGTGGTSSLAASATSSSPPSSSATGRAWGRPAHSTSDALSMLVETREGDAAEWSQVGGMQAFARVNTVAEASPAARAELQPNDEILSFGGLDASSAHRVSSRKDLGNLPSVVQEGKEIIVLAIRKDAQGNRAIKRIRLTPTSEWGGRGLLGCHIVPL